MTPLFVVLLVGFAIFRAVGFHVPWFADWQHSLRAALGLMFLLTASAHWGKRRPYLVCMVPQRLGPFAEQLVTLTGIAEIAIALGLQAPSLARWAAIAAIVMLCALFPANVKAAREHMSILNTPCTPILPRALAQIFFIAVLALSAWPR
jgi:uncharacterized membrane protein